MKTSGYTINIIPPDGIYEKFDRIIKKLAKENGTLEFAPHITLLGQASDNEESARKLMEELTADQNPFSVTLKNIAFQDYFFRALFVLVEKTEPLQMLHEKAKQIFVKPGTDEYMPHLSLLYGDFTPEIKEEIIKEIGNVKPANFMVSSLHLFKTDGESNEWYRIKEFPFKD